MKTFYPFLIVFVAGVIIGLLLYNNCNPPKINYCKSDTVYKTKTEVVLLPQEQGQVHEPTLVKEAIPIKQVTMIDSFIAYETYQDTALILRLIESYDSLWSEYNTLRGYTDTAVFKNGTAITSFEVSKNKAQNIRQILDSVKQTIITIIVPDKKRVIGYFGLRASYQLDSTIYMGGAFGFKFKNDLQFKVHAMINTRSQKLFGGEFDIPIRLKKRR